MHSPRLMKRKGVLTRMAPARTAKGTPHQPRVMTSSTRYDPCFARRQEACAQPVQAAIQALTGEDHQKNDPLEHEYGRVGEVVPPLQQTTAGADAAEQDRHGNYGERILSGETRNQ